MKKVLVIVGIVAALALLTAGFVSSVSAEGTSNVLGRAFGRGTVESDWVDADGDGVCDNMVDEDGDGVCDNHSGAGEGTMRGSRAWMDSNGDGVCDGTGEAFVDENGDGICDNMPGVGEGTGSWMRRGRGQGAGRGTGVERGQRGAYGTQI